MRIHLKGVLALSIFIALFALALDVRLGLVAIGAAAIVDWLFIVGPLWPTRAGGSSQPPRDR